LVPGFVAALVGVWYTGGTAVWDDHRIIEQGLRDVDFDVVQSIWASPVGGGEVGRQYYRPMAYTIMALVYQFGFVGLHVAAVICHAISAVLVGLLGKDSRWPMMGGVIFAAHPAASEVLGWASALPDALAVVLGLLGVWSAVHFENRKGMVWALFAWCAAALCKPTGLLFGLVAMLLVKPERRTTALGAWLSVIIAWWCLRSWLGVQTPSVESWDLAGDSLGWAWSLYFWPFPVTAVRDLWALAEWQWMLGWFGVMMLGVVALWRRLHLALVGWAVMVIGPILAIPIILQGYLVADRYVYLGVLGVGWIFAALIPKNRWMGFLVAICVGGALVFHVQRASAWTSDETLFQDAAEAYPSSSYGWHFLGHALHIQGDEHRASLAFENAVRGIRPHPMDFTFFVRCAVEAGRAQDALKWAENEGPKENLTAEYIAWWAKAAMEAGDLELAKARLIALKKPDHWDGPGWVAGFAQELGL